MNSEDSNEQKMTQTPALSREARRLRRQDRAQRRLGRQLRTTWIGHAMSTKTAVDLLNLARQRYGTKNARLAVLVRTGAIERTVDNARDAGESIRRLRSRLMDPVSHVPGIIP